MNPDLQGFLDQWVKGKPRAEARGKFNKQKDMTMFEDTRKMPVGNGVESGDGKTPSAKQVRWKLKTSGIELMTITPAVAAAMLEYNTRNRPMTERAVQRQTGVVADYARQMKAGKWRLTRMPIIFSKSGHLQDGQHRLRAIMLSGATIQAYVAFGEPDENFAFIDVGKKRTTADIFAINGAKNYVIMAAASRWIMAYEACAVSGGNGLSFSPTADEIYQFYLKNQRLQESISIAELFGKCRLAPASMMTALHYICAQKSRAKADEFFQKIGTGIGFSGKKEPAYVLHRRMIDNFGSAAKIRPVVLAALTLKAWNAERDGRPVGSLKWRGDGAPDEVFPKAV